MKCKKAILKMTAGIIISASASMAQAVPVYDSLGQGGSTAGCSQFAQTCIFGDIVTLAGTERLMTGFEFDYLSDFTADGDETAILRLFHDDGTSGLPGTEFFTSSAMAIAPSVSRDTFSMGILTVTVPDTFFWAIEFNGFTFESGDRIALFRTALPTVGTSDEGYYTDLLGTGWTASGGTLGVPNSLQARITANVPEPSIALLMASGLIAFGVVRRKSRK